MKNYVKACDTTETITYQDITPGGAVYEPMTSELVNTGDWRVNIPTFIAEKCKHCMLCIPVCPDSSIPVVGKERLDFDFKHCKGCGICYKVCPFDAIEFGKEDK